MKSIILLLAILILFIAFKKFNPKIRKVVNHDLVMYLLYYSVKRGSAIGRSYVVLIKYNKYESFK